MMRASEVRGLLQASEAESATPSPAPPTPAEASPPVYPATPRAARPAPSVPTEPSGRESRILGQKSALVSKTEEEAERVLQPPERLAASVRPAMGVAGSEFQSSRYEEETPAEQPTEIQEGAELQYEEPSGAVTVKPETAGSTRTAYDVERVTTCSNCGSVINIDMYEYPHEVYSAMGNARLSQARFFIVQGKYPEATKVLNIAGALFTKAEDSNGTTLVQRLLDSLQRES